MLVQATWAAPVPIQLDLLLPPRVAPPAIGRPLSTPTPLSRTFPNGMQSQSVSQVEKDSARGRRRRRGQTPKTSKVVLLNTSGRPQLREALLHFAGDNGSGHGAEIAPVAAIVIQEHKQRGLAWQDEVHNASKPGWSLRGAEAHVGDVAGERPKCGVAVAVRAHIGVAKAKGCPVDASPSTSPGRVAAVWVDGILRGGMLIVSVYLWHSEGLSKRNWAILYSAVEVAKRFGGPFMIAGDFNMAPRFWPPRTAS